MNERVSLTVPSVHLNMSTYVHTTQGNTEARPVALGIKDTNLYMSCHMDGDKPTLHLEVKPCLGSHLKCASLVEKGINWSHATKLGQWAFLNSHEELVIAQSDLLFDIDLDISQAVEDKDSLSTISAGSDMERFLFYKQDTGLNISTLMSAHFPNWYISTATHDNRPVEMCQETASRYRNFSIQRQN